MIAASLRLALTLLLVTACDPDEILGNATTDATPPDPAKAEAKAAAKKVAETKKAAADEFAVCMAGCIDGHAQSPTDRQTCRLSCGAERITGEGPDPSAGTKAAVARFETCIDADCAKAGSVDDAATCRLNCAQAALSGQGAPALAATARGCAVSCLEQTGDCEASCRGTPDDAATCKLQCSSLGGHCLGHCEADPSATPKLVTKPEGKAAGAGAVEPAVSVPNKTLEQLPAPQ